MDIQTKIIICRREKDNGREVYAQLVSTAIDNLSDDKYEELRDFIVTIPNKQYSKHDIENFYTELVAWLDNNSFREQDCYIFEYNRKKEIVRIKFNRKTIEENKKIENCDNILFAYEIGEEHTSMLSDIIDRLTDINTLIKDLQKNASETGMQKFPLYDGKKILLNILRMPKGFDIFLNIYLQQGFDYNLLVEINKNENKFKSAANESYLLYYFDDYCINIHNSESESSKIVLLCIPLIRGIFEKPTLFDLTE